MKRKWPFPKKCRKLFTLFVRRIILKSPRAQPRQNRFEGHFMCSIPNRDITGGQMAPLRPDRPVLWSTDHQIRWALEGNEATGKGEARQSDDSETVHSKKITGSIKSGSLSRPSCPATPNALGWWRWVSSRKHRCADGGQGTGDLLLGPPGAPVLP